MLAHRAYEAAHPWTATKVVSADECDDIWSIGETGRMDSLLAKWQCTLANFSSFEQFAEFGDEIKKWLGPTFAVGVDFFQQLA